MSDEYTDRNYRFDRRFWRAFNFHELCDCGYNVSYGDKYKWDLLDASVDVSCPKCGMQWSVAVNEVGRRKVQKLLDLEQEFYVVRAKLADIIDKLHGRK